MLGNAATVGYSAFGLASNITGLASSHTKAGVAAEAALSVCGLTTLAVEAVRRGNGAMLWTAVVGGMAFGRSFAQNIRYTKLCPKRWRMYENAADMTQPAEKEQAAPKKTFIEHLVSLPADCVRSVAQMMQFSENDKVAHFAQNVVEISQRKMFVPGTLALTGIVPLLADGIVKGLATGDWKQAIGGGCIFIGNCFSAMSIPQKQDHPARALFRFGRSFLPD